MAMFLERWIVLLLKRKILLEKFDSSRKLQGVIDYTKVHMKNSSDIVMQYK